MLGFQDVLFTNWSFEEYLEKKNYPPCFIDSLIKSFLDNLCTLEVIVQNIPKGMLLLRCRSWEVIRSKLEKTKVFYY